MTEINKEKFQKILDNLNKMQEIFSVVNTNKTGLFSEVLSIKNAVNAVEDAGINIYLALLKKENPRNIELSIQKRSDVINILKENKLEDKIVYNNENGTISFNLNMEEATKVRSTILRRCNLEKGDLIANYLIENNGKINKLKINNVEGSAAEFQKNIIEVEKSYLLDRNFIKQIPEDKSISTLDCLDCAALFMETIEELKEILNKQNMSALVKLEQSKKALEQSLKGLFESLIVINNEKNISIEVENRIDIKREIEKFDHVLILNTAEEFPQQKERSHIYVINKGESLQIISSKEQATRIRSHLQNNCHLSNNEINSSYLFENEESVYKIKLKTDVKNGSDFESNILNVQKIIVESYNKIVSGDLGNLDIKLTVLPKASESVGVERKKGIRMV